MARLVPEEPSVIDEIILAEVGESRGGFGVHCGVLMEALICSQLTVIVYRISKSITDLD